MITKVQISIISSQGNGWLLSKEDPPHKAKLYNQIGQIEVKSLSEDYQNDNFESCIHWHVCVNKDYYLTRIIAWHFSKAPA